MSAARQTPVSAVASHLVGSSASIFEIYPGLKDRVEIVKEKTMAKVTARTDIYGKVGPRAFASSLTHSSSITHTSPTPLTSALAPNSPTKAINSPGAQVNDHNVDVNVVGPAPKKRSLSDYDEAASTGLTSSRPIKRSKQSHPPCDERGSPSSSVPVAAAPVVSNKRKAADMAETSAGPPPAKKCRLQSAATIAAKKSVTVSKGQTITTKQVQSQKGITEPKGKMPAEKSGVEKETKTRKASAPDEVTGKSIGTAGPSGKKRAAREIEDVTAGTPPAKKPRLQTSSTINTTGKPVISSAPGGKSTKPKDSQAKNGNSDPTKKMPAGKAEVEKEPKAQKTEPWMDSVTGKYIGTARPSKKVEVVARRTPLTKKKVAEPLPRSQLKAKDAEVQKGNTASKAQKAVGKAEEKTDAPARKAVPPWIDENTGRYRGTARPSGNKTKSEVVSRRAPLAHQNSDSLPTTTSTPTSTSTSRSSTAPTPQQPLQSPGVRTQKQPFFTGTDNSFYRFLCGNSTKLASGPRIPKKPGAAPVVRASKPAAAPPKKEEVPPRPVLSPEEAARRAKRDAENAEKLAVMERLVASNRARQARSKALATFRTGIR